MEATLFKALRDNGYSNGKSLDYQNQLTKRVFLRLDAFPSYKDDLWRIMEIPDDDQQRKALKEFTEEIMHYIMDEIMNMYARGGQGSRTQDGLNQNKMPLDDDTEGPPAKKQRRTDAIQLQPWRLQEITFPSSSCVKHTSALSSPECIKYTTPRFYLRRPHRMKMNFCKKRLVFKEEK